MEAVRVYGIGNILIDIFARVSDEDISALKLAKGTMHLTEGEERRRILSFIENQPVSYRPGGSAPNVIMTLAGLETSSALSGRIGNDRFGTLYESRLRDQGARSCLKAGPGDTGTSIILITPDSERTMNTHLGVNRDYSPRDIDPKILAQADFFFFTGYMWDTENQKAALREAIKIARDSGTKIVFDAADPFAVTRHHGEFVHLIENHFDVVLANREEARLIFHEEDLERCAGRLSELCDTAIIKDGPRGSVIRQGDKTHHIPVNPVTAVDTTGAGDIYAAGYLYGLCRGWEISRAGKFASYLASRIVTVTGAQFEKDELTRIRQAVEDGTWDRF